MSGAADAGQYGALAVLIISTLLNAAYFLPIVYAAFFRPLSAEDAHHPHGEAPRLMVVALMLTTTATLSLFLFSAPLLELVEQLVVPR